jgi:hypothetical protein
MEPAFTLCVRTSGVKKVSVSLSEAKDLPVSELRRMAASHAGNGLSADEVNLMYCGRLLRDDDFVSNVGLKAGSTVHVLRRPRSFAPPAAEPRTLSDAEMRQFFTAFGMAIRQPALNVVFRRLTEDCDNLESLAAACPGLASDHTALALLSKPEMLLMLLKPEVLQKAAKEHPALIEAMQNLAAAVHEERPTPAGSTAGAEADGTASSIAAPMPLMTCRMAKTTKRITRWRTMAQREHRHPCNVTVHSRPSQASSWRRPLLRLRILFSRRPRHPRLRWLLRRRLRREAFWA